MNEEYFKRASEKIHDKRALAILTAKRARQLAKGVSRPMIKTNEINYLDIALLEIAEGLLDYEVPNKEEEHDFLDE